MGNVYRRTDTDGIQIRWKDRQGRRRGRIIKTTSVKVAKEALAAEQAKVEKEKALGAPLPSEETFEDWADEFLRIQQDRITPTVVRGKLSRAEFIRQKGIIESKLKPFFRGMKIGTIRKADVIRYRNKRTGQVSDATVVKECNVLKRLFNVALDLDKISANPAQRVELPQAAEGRTRFLSTDEWKRVFAACRIEGEEQWLQQACGLAISTGCRRGELLSITVPDVDLHRRQVALTKTKNGRPRTVVINALALAVFESMGISERRRRGDRGTLWPSITPEQLSMRFLRACRAAGVENMRWHDLRHSFASTLRMAGADLHDLMVLGGWSDLRMVTRYSHLTAEHLQKAAARMDGVLTLPKPEETE